MGLVEQRSAMRGECVGCGGIVACTREGIVSYHAGVPVNGRPRECSGAMRPVKSGTLKGEYESASFKGEKVARALRETRAAITALPLKPPKALPKETPMPVTSAPIEKEEDEDVPVERHPAFVDRSASSAPFEAREEAVIAAICALREELTSWPLGVTIARRLGVTPLEVNRILSRLAVAGRVYTISDGTYEVPEEKKPVPQAAPSPPGGKALVGVEPFLTMGPTAEKLTAATFAADALADPILALLTHERDKLQAEVDTLKAQIETELLPKTRRLDKIKSALRAFDADHV